MTSQNTTETMGGEVELGEEVTALLEEYHGAHGAYTDEWTRFAAKHSSFLRHLNEMREARNVSLTTLCKALRGEALELYNDLKVKVLRAAEFTVTVPLRTNINMPKLLRGLAKRKNKNLLQEALDDGVLVKEITVPKNGIAKLGSWAAKRGLTKLLEECITLEPDTPRVTGNPGPVPPLGQPYKDK